MAVSTNRPVTSAEGELHALVSFQRPVCIASRVGTIRSNNNNLRMYLCVPSYQATSPAPAMARTVTTTSDAANCARLRLAGLAARTMENNV